MVESCVRGFHVYHDIWTPTTGEKISCVTEDTNPIDLYAVAIKRRTEVIGHVPHKISAACFLFIQRGGIFHCVITDSHRQYSSDLVQGGLQISYKLEFECDNNALMLKIKKLIQSTPPINFQCQRTVTKRKLEPPPKAKDELPVKKRPRTMGSSIFDLDVTSECCESAHDIAKEDPWVSFGRCILTTVDKDIILQGMALAVLIQ